MFQKSCTFDEFLIKIFAVNLIILFGIGYKEEKKLKSEMKLRITRIERIPMREFCNFVANVYESGIRKNSQRTLSDSFRVNL